MAKTFPASFTASTRGLALLALRNPGWADSVEMHADAVEVMKKLRDLEFPEGVPSIPAASIAVELSKWERAAGAAAVQQGLASKFFGGSAEVLALAAAFGITPKPREE